MSMWRPLSVRSFYLFQPDYIVKRQWGKIRRLDVVIFVVYGNCMTSTEKLLREIEAAAKKIGITPSYLCMRAIGNGHLFDRMKNHGASPTLETADKVREYIKGRLADAA